MNRLLIFAGLLFSVSAAADDVHEVLDASAKSAVRIFNTAGDIEVRGWSRKQVEVTAELGSGVKELIFERDGDEIVIEVKTKKRNSRHISSDLVIQVPEGSSLEIDAVSADISVDDIRGRQLLESVSGDIETTAFKSNVVLESVSGDIDLEGSDEKIRVRLKTVSGDIDAQNLDGEIEVGTVNGEVVLYDSRFETAEIQTVNGDVVYQSGLYGESRMHMETVNGDLNIEFTDDVSARFDIETFNGSIRNCFGPEAKRTSKYAPGRELQFTEGGGKGRVVIRTLNGDLELCKD